jgi:hypothetical protein
MGDPKRHPGQSGKWTSIEEKKANPLGISIPGGWKRRGGMKGHGQDGVETVELESDGRGRGRKRSVTWEKD